MFVFVGRWTIYSMFGTRSISFRYDKPENGMLWSNIFPHAVDFLSLSVSWSVGQPAGRTLAGDLIPVYENF